MRFQAAALVVFCSASAYGQTSVTERRVFEQETVTASSLGYVFDFGLIGPTQPSDGTIVRVSCVLSVAHTYDIRIRNQSGASQSFVYAGQSALLPRAAGDCSVYGYVNAVAQVGPIAANDLAVINDTRWRFLAFDQGFFDTGCGIPWQWDGLELWDGVVGAPDPLTYGSGTPVPSNWLETLELEFALNGFLEVEWIPNPLPTVSVCPGSAATAVGLDASGTATNLWIQQAGAPAGWNLLLASRQASSTLNPSGLCLGAGVAPIVSLRDSLSLGGEPYRLPVPAVSVGQPMYFQSWFRTHAGTGTSECIEVTLL